MKVLILAGGFGTRITEENEIKPKPMVEIGGKPIIWHIMKIYSHYGFNDFVILLGYKGYIIKEYFANYFLHQSDLTIDLAVNSVETIQSKAEPWKITLLDTGINTLTAGRIKKVQQHVGNERFMLTYGDGVSDININNLLEFHTQNSKTATVTAVRPLGRFGSLNLDDNSMVSSFQEKTEGENSWINGGFFVFEPEIFNYISNEDSMLEDRPLQALVKADELVAYKHGGFWKAMDTPRDRLELERLWNSDKAPWKFWE